MNRRKLALVLACVYLYRRHRTRTRTSINRNRRVIPTRTNGNDIEVEIKRKNELVRAWLADCQTMNQSFANSIEPIGNCTCTYICTLHT